MSGYRTIFVNRLKELVGDEYILIGEYKGLDKPTDFRHKCGYIRAARPAYIHKLKNCPQCNPYKSFNVGAVYIRGVLDSRLKAWRADIKEKYQNKCAISGLTNNLVVHHIRSLESIIKECLEEFGCSNTHELENDFKRKEELINLVVQRHTLNDGVLLNKEVHQFLHSVTSKNADIGQWQCFLNKMNGFEYIYDLPIKEALKRYFNKKGCLI